MKMTKIKWSKDMEARCLALFGTGAARAAKKVMVAMVKKPEKSEKHIKPAKHVEPEEPAELEMAARPAEPAIVAPPQHVAVEPVVKSTKVEIPDYPVIFNFDDPEGWEEFRIAMNISSL